MSHAAFPELKKSGDALILNISATLHYGATWYQVHASAAKAAIDRCAGTRGGTRAPGRGRGRLAHLERPPAALRCAAGNAAAACPRQHHALARHGVGRVRHPRGRHRAGPHCRYRGVPARTAVLRPRTGSALTAAPSCARGRRHAVSDTAGSTKLMGPAAAEFVAEIIPLRRFGTKADIGLTAVFLARHAARHRSGEAAARVADPASRASVVGRRAGRGHQLGRQLHHGRDHRRRRRPVALEAAHGRPRGHPRGVAQVRPPARSADVAALRGPGLTCARVGGAAAPFSTHSVEKKSREIGIPDANKAKL